MREKGKKEKRERGKRSQEREQESQRKRGGRKGDEVRAMGKRRQADCGQEGEI